MAEEYNPMQDPTAAVERAKRKRVKKVRGQAGRAVTEDPNAPPAKKPTRVQGPTAIQRDSDVQRAAGIPEKRKLPLKKAPRKPGGKPGEGKLQKVTPKKAPPKKTPTPKKYTTPKAPLGRKGPGQMQREAASVDLKTGKPKAGYWQRLKAFATRHERPTRPARTMEERAASIGRTAEKGIGGFGKGRKPGGQINIPAMRRRQQTFPGLRADEQSLHAPQGKLPVAEVRGRQLTRRGPGGQTTVSTLPTAGEAQTGQKYRAKLSPAIEGQRGVGPIRQTEAGIKGQYLGKFEGKGTPAVVQKQQARVEKAPTTPRRAPTPTKKMSLWEKIKAGAAEAGRGFVKMGAEMQQQSKQQTGKPTGQYGTKEQAQKGAKAVKKVVVPKKFTGK